MQVMQTQTTQAPQAPQAQQAVPAAQAQQVAPASQAPQMPPAGSDAPPAASAAISDSTTPPAPSGLPTGSEQANTGTQATPAQQAQQGTPYTPQHADPRVHAVEGMLAERGLGTEQVHAIFAKALETRDVRDVDQGKLKEALGEAGAKLAMQNLEAFSADVARAAKTLYDTAVNLTGGEESYKQFSQWVQGNADPEVQELRAAVANGGKLAYLALDALNKAWRTQSQHAVGAGALITPDSGSAGVTVTPFSSRREYVNAMKEAHKSKDQNKIAQVQARFASSPV